ncbi:hypothetical protein EGW08_018420 [Elysia chlorotica]|uniref:Aftiphilin clathrin-binding box domain-containing protein n=1 Tax=Elysia chlorotica TaxID=188477 RepID=A0A3S0ZBC9_ELYCH|nr:hypothetical protein EGW08_018420 [Elysia chlorotica]
MSNIIPIVSSSPPPFDEDGGWDEDNDDDFGNFASAPNTNSNEKDCAQEISFEADFTSTEAFQTTEQSPISPADQIVSTTPVNGFSHGPQRQDETLGFESSECHQKHNHGHKLSNNDCGVSTTSCKEESEDCSSDIPAAVDLADPTSDLHMTSESFNSVLENLPSMPNSEESVSLPGSKINESVVSNSSTTDSGVFSSDLSPSSYSENSSTPQNNCDSKIGPKSHTSLTAEISNDHLNDISDHEDHQAKENPSSSSQDEACLQGSFKDNCDNINSQDEGDWGDFNDAFANSDNSSDRDKLPFPAFGDNSHSTNTDDTYGCSDLKEIVDNDDIIDDESEILPDEVKNQFSHTVSNKTQNFESDIDTKPSVLDSFCVNAKTECHAVEKSSIVCEDASEENQESVSETDQSAPSKDLSLSKNQECPVHDEQATVVDASGRDTSTCDIEDQAVTINDDSSQSHQVEDKIETTENTEGLSKFDSVYDETKLESQENDRSSPTEHYMEVGSVETECAHENSSGVVKKAEGCDQITGVVREAEEGDLDDTEFGFFDEKKNDPAQEVTPITFRTSVCEDDDETEDKEIPPFDDECDEEDDFGDFGDFSSMPAAGLSEEADDFGDFDSGMKTKPEESGSAVDDEDDFGDFGEANTADDGDAGWADFGSGATAFDTQPDSDSFSGEPTPDTFVTGTSTDQVKSKIVSALEKCFPVCVNEDSGAAVGEVSEHTDLSDPEKGEVVFENKITTLDVVVELGLSNTEEAKQQTWTVVQHPAKKDPRVRVWGQMKDFDASNALAYGWPTSHCSQEVYNTLHIDTQNILFTQKKQAVPFFASGLGILEPTRGGAEAKREKGSGLGAPIQPALLDTAASSKQAPAPALAAQDIPPVDFDWSVSGLTNPLTVFKSDVESGAAFQTGLQPLEEMLKKSTPTAKLATQEVLSPEAQRILIKMPDLSFMQSKVLMFPIKQ